MVVSAAGGDDDVQVRFRLGEGRGRGGMKRERWGGRRRGGGIQRSAWVIGVVVQSSKVQISGTPTLLLFDLHSQ